VEVRPGAIIGGRYRAERRLGKGGVGEVWSGVALSDGSRVAIKTLLHAAAHHHELVTRFRREASFLERIRSQYVSRVLEFLSDDVFGLVLVMELIEGEALNEVLRKRSLGVEEAIEVCWDVLGGIADLHREQIIHRDLKPGNIILKELPNGKRRAVIVDFGMSRFTGLDDEGEEVTALTRADIAVGTMEYMAPEQILNSRGVTASADIYALGAMMYRALAGQHIFGDLKDAVLARKKMLEDPPPLELGRSDPLALGLSAVVMRMIQKHPHDRYARAEDVLSDLASLRAGGVPDAALASSPAHSQPAQSQPVQSAPMHSAPSQSSPSPTSLPSTVRDAAPAPRRTGLAIGVTLVVFAGAALGGIYVLRPAWLAIPTRRAPLAEEPPISAVAPPVSASASVALPAAPAPSASIEADAAAAAIPSASAAPVPRPIAAAARRPRVASTPSRPPSPPAEPKPLATDPAPASTPTATSPAPSEPAPTPIETP
jgi:serine/threonine-protein kinase